MSKLHALEFSAVLHARASFCYRKTHPRHRQRGSALISALFIMTLIAIAATAMTMRVQLDIYRTRLILTTDKLYHASQLAVFWAIHELHQPHNSFSTSQDNGVVAVFPKTLSGSYPPFKLSGTLSDLQSRFNINNLNQPLYFLNLYRLLNHLHNPQSSSSFTLTPSQKKELIVTMTQWIMPYQPGRGKDKLLSYYLAQKPAYLPAYQMLNSLSELRLIKGVSPSIYQRLTPELSALPEITPLNINTASTAQLRGLGLTATQVTRLIKKRGETGFQSTQKLAPFLEKLNLRAEQVTIQSNYFLCTAVVQGDEQKLTSFTLLKRSQNKHGQLNVSIIAQTLNSE